MNIEYLMSACGGSIIKLKRAIIKMPERSDFHHYSLFIFEAGRPAGPHKMQNIFIYMESVALSREERV
jgi:hypothetical protein